MNALFTFKSTIAGIPCQIEVTSLDVVRGSYSPYADSDLDFYGYVDEFDYNVLDRRGRPAPWLERKLTDADKDRLFDEAIKKEQKACEP